MCVQICFCMFNHFSATRLDSYHQNKVKLRAWVEIALNFFFFFYICFFEKFNQMALKKKKKKKSSITKVAMEFLNFLKIGLMLKGLICLFPVYIERRVCCRSCEFGQVLAYRRTGERVLLFLDPVQICTIQLV